MPLRCNPVKLKNAVFLAISVLVSGGIISARAADQSDDTSHKSIIGVPSMGEDFVQAPELNSHGLAAPGSQFRYLKMDYAVRKDIEPDNKSDASDTAPPAKKAKGLEQSANQNANQSQSTNQNSTQSSTTTAQSGPSNLRGEGLRLDPHSAPLDLAPLNLSPEQKQKICDLHKENVKKAREIRKILKTKKEDLATAMFDPDQAEATIRDKRDAVRQAREQMEDLAFDEILRVRQLLNPEQKKHLAEVKPAHRPDHIGIALGKREPVILLKRRPEKTILPNRTKAKLQDQAKLRKLAKAMVLNLVAVKIQRSSLTANRSRLISANHSSLTSFSSWCRPNPE